MTVRISRQRRNLRVQDRLTPELIATIREKLANQSMSAIARGLNLPVHVIRYVRDMPKKQKTKPRDPVHEAKLYVLSKIGKCTDGFARFEQEVNQKLQPITYERDTTSKLAKVRPGFIPYSERN